MKKVQRAISLALAIALSAAMVTGCKSGDSKGSTSTSNTAVKFPLATPTTLTIWYSNSYPGLLGKYPDYSQLPKYKELQKKTNITIKVVTPPIGQEKDQFNLMLASGTQPDIFDMYSVNNYYSGGMQ